MTGWLKSSLYIGAALVLTTGVVAWSDDDDDRVDLSARLIGFQEVPSVSSVARGEFKGRLTRDGLAYTLRYSGLEANVLFAHIHFGQEGVNGGVMTFLCGGGSKPDPCPQSGVVRGFIDMDDITGSTGSTNQGIAPGEFREFVRAIRGGKSYANVHSVKFPGGEIRGQIKVDDDD